MLEGGEGQVEEEICLENQGYTGLAASQPALKVMRAQPRPAQPPRVPATTTMADQSCKREPSWGQRNQPDDLWTYKQSYMMLLKSLSFVVICYAVLFVVTEKRQNYLRENSADSVLCLHPKVPKRNRIVGILPPFFFFFLVTPHGMWDLNSLTRDQTHAPWNGSTES